MSCRRFPARAACLALLASLFVGAPISRAAEWKAGAAKIEITPEEPLWMSGYAGRDKPAQGKLTPLWAKALVLEDPTGKQAVLVTLDLVGIGRDLSVGLAKALEEKHKIPRASLAFCCSHTHTGPVVGDTLRSMYFLGKQQEDLILAYTRTLESRVLAVVAQALEKRAPARLSWSTGRATFAVNRRNNKEGDVPKLREAGKLVGPVDYDVPVLAVRDAEGALTAVAFSYACHATVLSSLEWSGDWPGFAQMEIEKAHPQAVALFFAGCGADQNPIPRRTVELAREYGQKAAAAVALELASVQSPISGELAVDYAEIDLALDTLPTREDLQRATESKDRFVASRAKRLLAQWDRDGKLAASYPYPVQSWRLGSANQPGPHLHFLGGEVVVDFSLRLKLELGRRTWVAAYANDVMAYIPSRRVLNEGGYEGAGAMVYYGLPTSWAADVEEKIVREVHRQAKSLGVESAR